MFYSLVSYLFVLFLRFYPICFIYFSLSLLSLSMSMSSSFSLSLSMPPYVFSILWRFTKTLSWSTFAILLNKLKLHSAPTSDVACAAFLWLAWLQHFSHAFATLYYPMRSCQYFRSFVAASIFVLVLLLLKKSQSWLPFRLLNKQFTEKGFKLTSVGFELRSLHYHFISPLFLSGPNLTSFCLFLVFSNIFS